MTTNKYPDIDYAQLKLAIEEKAKAVLSEVTEDSLKAFSQDIKLIAEGIMEQYAFTVYDLYTEGARKISDMDLLSAFTNYADGYQSKMLKWNEDNPIQLREHPIEIPIQPQASKISRNKPIATIGIGTVIAIGLYIFSNVWVALAAELLAVAIAYKQKRGNTKKQATYNRQLKEYEIKVARMRQELIDGLTADLVKWLENGKTYSDSVLASYNL